VRCLNPRQRTQLFVMHLGDLSEGSQIIPLPDAVEQTMDGDCSDHRKELQIGTLQPSVHQFAMHDQRRDEGARKKAEQANDPKTAGDSYAP
jgi:hypothetical protein